MDSTKACAATLGALLLSGCAHNVPSITRDRTSADKASPTVEKLIGHINCELWRANKSHPVLSDAKYVATIALFLQVEDTIGTGPSGTYTEPLKPPSTSLVTSLGLELSGQRLRKFTTTYTVDATKLSALSEECKTDAEDAKPLRYRLDGDLRLAEIVADGLLTRRRTDDLIFRTGDKTRPTFGSEVQFIVTRGVSTFGPVWTLRYWKGPGNLLAGKQVYKNNLIVTFAPPVDPTLSANMRASRARLDLANKEADRLKGELFTLQGRISGATTPGLRSSLERLQREASAAKARADDEVANARMAVDDAEANDAAVNDAVQSAARASNDLLTTMLLQNLTR